MLPPDPVTTAMTTTKTMETQTTTNTNTTTKATQYKANHKQPQQQHYESAFLYESLNHSADASVALTSSENSHATSNSATQRLKAFFNKTLANVSKTNVSDYNASVYSSSSSSSSTPAQQPIQLAASRTTYDDIVVATITDGIADGINVGGVGGFVGNITDGFGSYATAAAADMAVSHNTTHLEMTTVAAASAFPTAQTVATFIAGNKNRATTIIVYPTVSPESIVIPIVSCIFGFPILAFIVICCLRHRAKLARERDRRRNYDMQDHAVSLVRFSPIHRLNYRSSRAISLRPERSLSQGFTSLELDTVVEERCSDVEQTQTEIIHPESPMESSTSYKMSMSSS